jgi:iron(III) transport system substrate-binding protein
MFVLMCFLFSLLSCKQPTQQTETTASVDSTQTTAKGEVNVYSHRHYEADIELFNEFEKQTGIKVNVVKADADQLTQRLKMEGQNSPADILMTVDAGRLYRAKEEGLLQAVSSETLTQTIPSYLRDKDNFWFAFTQRARVVVYDKTKVKPTDLTSYEDLTSPKWKGKILVRPSENIYNQSLLASFIAHSGTAEAKKWAAGIVKNMAREPKGKDKDQVFAVANGEGTLAIVNTYYVGQMMTSKDSAERQAVAKVGVFFPTQKNFGTHVNISGAGVCKYSPNKENAIKLLEFLVSEKAQQVYAQANQEYPVRAGVAYSTELTSLGSFKTDTLDLSLLGKFNADAVKIFDEVKWK